MPMTAFDENAIPCQSFSVPGSGRLEGWNPVSPPARAATVISGGGRGTFLYAVVGGKHLKRLHVLNGNMPSC